MIDVEAKNSIDLLSSLKSRLKGILGLFDINSRIYYIDYPVHSNVGDLLINLGTEKFFLEYEIPIYERYSLLNIANISASKTDTKITFLCQGGGNFGDIYSEQNVRDQLLIKFPQARIIFLPQTLYYSSKEKQRDSLQKIAQHPNCHILVRDQESLSILHDAHLNNSSMMPDMAHQLWGILKPNSEPQYGKDIHFLRQDKESAPIPAELEEKFLHGHIDWNDIISVPHKARIGTTQFFLNVSGRIIPPNFNASIWYSVRDAIIRDAVDYFSCHDHVYTNRLHAMLLALLLGHDVTAFDNSYNKLGRYVNAWLAPNNTK